MRSRAASNASVNRGVNEQRIVIAGTKSLSITAHRKSTASKVADHLSAHLLGCNKPFAAPNQIACAKSRGQRRIYGLLNCRRFGFEFERITKHHSRGKNRSQGI